MLQRKSGPITALLLSRDFRSGGFLSDHTLLLPSTQPTQRIFLQTGSNPNSFMALSNPISNPTGARCVQRFPRALEGADPDIPILKEAKAEYAKQQ